MAQRHFSPLRYPGGKGKLQTFVRDLIRANDLEGGSYSEPYAGGASVALGLLMEDHVSEVHINDIDEGIFSFWHSILNYPDEFLRKLWDAPLTVEEWQRQNYIRRNKNEFDQLDVGFSTFYLNRTNRSGVINAGVIGGLDQSGNYKIDARFNKEGLAKRIMAVACHKAHIHISQQDAIDFITTTLPQRGAKGLVFLDPPYYLKGSKLYTSFYKHDDHVKVAEAIKSSPHKHWIVTYDNVEQIENIYDLTDKVIYNLRYSLNHKSTGGSEILFHSPNVKLPYHPDMQ